MGEIGAEVTEFFSGGDDFVWFLDGVGVVDFFGFENGDGAFGGDAFCAADFNFHGLRCAEAVHEFQEDCSAFAVAGGIEKDFADLHRGRGFGGRLIGAGAPAGGRLIRRGRDVLRVGGEDFVAMVGAEHFLRVIRG